MAAGRLSPCTLLPCPQSYKCAECSQRIGLGNLFFNHARSHLPADNCTGLGDFSDFSCGVLVSVGIFSDLWCTGVWKFRDAKFREFQETFVVVLKWTKQPNWREKNSFHKTKTLYLCWWSDWGRLEQRDRDFMVSPRLALERWEKQGS